MPNTLLKDRVTGFQNTAHDGLYDRPKKSLTAYGFNSSSVCITAKETTWWNIESDINFFLEETSFSAVRNPDFSHGSLIFLYLLFKEALFMCVVVAAKIEMLCYSSTGFFQVDWFNRIFIWFNRNFLLSNVIDRSLFYSCTRFENFFSFHAHMEESATIYLETESNNKFTGSSK